MPPIRLRRWEIILLVPFCGIALLFLVGGQILAGVVLLALLAVGVVVRAEIRERNVAGGYAQTRGFLLAVESLALLAIYDVLVWMFWVIREEHWTRDRHGRVAFWALAGLAFFVARETYRLGDEASNWLLGSEMEREVADLLDQLRADGWLVTHDVRRDSGGNVDHFASGPTGAFVIETKRGVNRASARNQAVANAVWAKNKFGARWVTAVLCVGTDPPPQPVQQGHAWVVGPRDLVAFLRQHRR
jgi:hypothetical protein